MKRILATAAAFLLLAGTGAMAQDQHNDHQTDNHGAAMQGPAMKGPAQGPAIHGPAMAMSMKGPSHADWRKGGHIGHDDWNRGQKIDYRSHHLKAPPRGYEWRQVDGNYVLAAAATGLIASIILANH